MVGSPGACKFPVFAWRAPDGVTQEQKRLLAANPLQKQPTAGRATAVAVL